MWWKKALNHTNRGVAWRLQPAEYAEQRREMLQAWADYIDRLAPSGKSGDRRRFGLRWPFPFSG